MLLCMYSDIPTLTQEYATTMIICLTTVLSVLLLFLYTTVDVTDVGPEIFPCLAADQSLVLKIQTVDGFNFLITISLRLGPVAGTLDQ